MNYDFDTVYDRKNTNSLKYKLHPKYPEKTDLIPMWVADMDFKTAPEIISELQIAAQQGIYGYTEPDDEYYSLTINWYKKRFDFTVDKSWIVPINSVMFGIAAAIRALTAEHDSVMIFQPVYYPFEDVIKDNNRTPVISELKSDGGRYAVDFDDFEKKIIRNNIKVLLFCSPHNPVGRVWSKAELEHIAEICQRHGTVIISDEIHSDLTFKKHTPVASLSDETAAITVTLTSATKTFNLAGIQGANVIVSDRNIRNKIKNEIKSTKAAGLNLMYLSAAKAAYKYGEAWLTSLLEYIKANMDYVAESFKNTKIKTLIPEATYLVWLDCRALGLSDRELDDFFINKCGVWLNNGSTFGAGGNGFMRMNVACPRVTLNRAVNNILNCIGDE